jgi:hypothetical protein
MLGFNPDITGHRPSVRSKIQTLLQVTSLGAEWQKCDNFQSVLKLGQNWPFWPDFDHLRLKVQPNLTNRAKI